MDKKNIGQGFFDLFREIFWGKKSMIWGGGGIVHFLAILGKFTFKFVFFC